MLTTQLALTKLYKTRVYNHAFTALHFCLKTNLWTDPWVQSPLVQGCILDLGILLLFQLEDPVCYEDEVGRIVLQKNNNIDHIRKNTEPSMMQLKILYNLPACPTKRFLLMRHSTKVVRHLPLFQHYDNFYLTSPPQSSPLWILCQANHELPLQVVTNWVHHVLRDFRISPNWRWDPRGALSRCSGREVRPGCLNPDPV